MIPLFLVYGWCVNSRIFGSHESSLIDYAINADVLSCVLKPAARLQYDVSNIVIAS